MLVVTCPVIYCSSHCTVSLSFSGSGGWKGLVWEVLAWDLLFFLIGQWLGAGMAPLYEVPWPPTWTLHTASWGFLTAWWPCGSKTAYSRLAAPGESAGAHVLRYLVQLNLSALAALTKYSDRGLTRQHCFLPVLKVSVSLAYWLSSPCVFTWSSLCTCQCPDLYL